MIREVGVKARADGSTNGTVLETVLETELEAMCAGGDSSARPFTILVFFNCTFWDHIGCIDEPAAGVGAVDVGLSFVDCLHGYS